MSEEFVHDRDLDAWIAEHVMGLKGVGYYRRKSWKTQGWERCKKGDTSPADAGEDDLPKGHYASLYYLHFSDDPDSVHAVPKFSSDMNHAYMMMDKMRSQAYVFDIHSLYGGAQIWCVQIQGCKVPVDSFHTKLAQVEDSMLPRALCRAAKIAWENSEHWDSHD